MPVSVADHVKCTTEGRNRGVQNAPLLGREKPVKATENTEFAAALRLC